jgi:hypothetical protein
MLLITNFLELRVVAGISRNLTGRQHAVSGRPMLIHTYHAVTLPRPCNGLERSLSERHIRGMACVNQTRPHCVNQMGKTHSKALAERHGRGTTWERHGMCKSALSVQLAMHICCIILSSVAYPSVHCFFRIISLTALFSETGLLNIKFVFFKFLYGFFSLKHFSF